MGARVPSIDFKCLSWFLWMVWYEGGDYRQTRGKAGRHQTLAFLVRLGARGSWRNLARIVHSLPLDQKQLVLLVAWLLGVPTRDRR